MPPPPRSTLFPYTTLFRSYQQSTLTRAKFGWGFLTHSTWDVPHEIYGALPFIFGSVVSAAIAIAIAVPVGVGAAVFLARSEEHTSELQSLTNLVCRLLLEK